jgi:anti-sigma regulatory factor (Ser/Thr protein kinase)
MHLDPEVAGPRRARAALRLWLQTDGLGGVPDDVLLVVSELVSNAVIHAASTIELSYRAGDSMLEVGVSDHDRRPPRLLRGPDGVPLGAIGSTGLAEGGRGLLLVAELADEWGTTQTTDGKRVWARWSVPRTDALVSAPR